MKKLILFLLTIPFHITATSLYDCALEHQNNERYVSHGDQGARFSALEGPQFAPRQGLSTSLVKGNEAYKDIH